MRPLKKRSYPLFLPGVTVIVATLFFAIIMPLPGLRVIAPDLTLITIFYWISYAQQTMPFLFVALIGLLYDALYGQPLGLSSLFYLLCWMLLQSYRRHLVKEELIAASLIFAVVSFVWFAAEQLILIAFFQSVTSPDWHITALRWLMTALLYIPSHLVLSRYYYKIRNKL